MNDLDLEECSLYGFESQMQLQGTHGYWHPSQLRKTDILVQTTARVMENQECVNLLSFETLIRIGMTVNDRGRFCAQIPILLTMVKLS